ncbi:MAG: hypothetical protein AAF297_09855 [Planctomycetota bacterium]
MRTAQHRTSRLFPIAAVTALIASLVGCHTPDYNARPVLAGAHPVPALSIDESTSELPPMTGVALRRIDRADWGTIEYLAPFDGVAHPPVWRGHARHRTSQSRAAGVAPTIETALDLPQDQGWRTITDTFGAHGGAALDVALLPVRAIVDWPNTRQVSPGILYKRTTPGRWTPGQQPEPKVQPIEDNG